MFAYNRFGALMKTSFVVLFAVFIAKVSLVSLNAVPMVFHYQGHIIESGRAVEGDAEFKFAFLDSFGETVWSHDGTSVGGSEPSSSITLNLRRGVYSVGLGDATILNMQAIPPVSLAADQLFLRVWFDGGGGVQLLSPDQMISSVAFAFRAHSAETAESLPDGLVEEKHLEADLLAKITSLEEQIAALTAELTAVSDKIESTALDRLVAVSTATEDPDLIDNGFELISTLATEGWIYGNEEGEPAGRAGHSGVWTGSHFLVWGGIQDSGEYFGSGSLYDFDLDRWAPVSPIDAPEGRAGHSSVWSDKELIVWGGVGKSGLLDSGGRYDTEFQFWRSLPTLLAPSPRTGHVAVWTGNEMIVWGGEDGGGPLTDHGIFDPVANSWTPIDLDPSPIPRSGHSGVWADDVLIIWGGEDFEGYFGDGSALSLSEGTPAAWTDLSEDGAPYGRIGHSSIWTGTVMIVWGGEDDVEYFDDGARYDPVADTWTALANLGAPEARSLHNAVWTGSEMIVHGGEDDDGPFEDSFAYDPETDVWRKLSDSFATGRTEATSVWAGTHLLTYGGYFVDGEVIPWLEYLEPVPVFHLFSKP
jgi:N-acetylneuraminic acid mutarotase